MVQLVLVQNRGLLLLRASLQAVGVLGRLTPAAGT